MSGLTMDLLGVALFTQTDGDVAVRVLLRLFVSVVLGSCIGAERARQRKDAGLATHALVSLGAALFTLAPLEAGLTNADLSHVIQGIAAGVGFLGAGTILKQTGELKPGATGHKIEGLTTAASIWLTAAVGASIGAGWLWPPVIALVLGWLILVLGHHIEHYIRGEP